VAAVARELGKLGFGWVDRESAEVDLQLFIFDNAGAPIRFKQRGSNCRVAEVVFDGEKWVENLEGAIKPQKSRPDLP
jgi:hypothetical protein